MEPPATGMTVVTTSGHRIGVVVEVGQDVFQVRLRTLSGADLWLASTAIFTVEDEKVTLVCEGDGLHRYGIERG